MVCNDPPSSQMQPGKAADGKELAEVAETKVRGSSVPVCRLSVIWLIIKF